MPSNPALSDAATVAGLAQPFERAADLEPLVRRASVHRIVLIGEASHGTHEFYAARAWLTRRLIEDHGHRAVAIEADWPDTFRAHRYVTLRSDDRSAQAALGDFLRFPRWMWRNDVMRDFVEWLRDFNRALPAGEQAGLYGLDLYSLHASIDAVLRYLDTVDPQAAKIARERYSCFEHFRQEPQYYGLAWSAGLESCEHEVIQQLVELERKRGELTGVDGHPALEEFFSAEQNARLVRDAERYYRAMFRGRDESWNLRDTHMADTLDALLARLPATAGIVVWAHNSHLGDARATEMSQRGEINLGQLARERHRSEAYAIGFSTYEGSVTAATDWGGEHERKRVRPGLAGSYEELLHETRMPRLWLDLHEEALALLRKERLQRAIGVIYRPDTERYSHYFNASLTRQFDAYVHIDRTRAVTPLDRREGEVVPEEAPETFPSAL